MDRLPDDLVALEPVEPMAGLGEVAAPAPAGVEVPGAVAGLGEFGPFEPSPEEEAAMVRPARSLGPRPDLTHRRAAPIEPPDLAAMGNAAAQSFVQSGGSAVAGAPMAAGAALTGAGRALATGPAQVIGIFDAVEEAEMGGQPGPVGALADSYRRLSPEGRAEARRAAGEAQRGRDEAGTGQGLQAAGAALRDTGRAAFEATDQFARSTFPVAEEREHDSGVRFARAVGSLPPALAAGAAAGPVGMAGFIAGSAYANTFNEARQTLIRSGLSEDEADRRAADAATANAFTQAGLMTVPFVRLLDRLGPSVQAGFLSTLRQMAQSGVEFSGSNAVGRVLENYLARGGYDPDRAITREVWESLGPEALAGAALPGGAAAARAAGSAGRRASASEGVQRAAADVQEAFTVAGERPEAAAAAVERFAREVGLPDNVRVRLTDQILTPEGTTADGRFDPTLRLVEIALDADPSVAASRVFHEGAGHAALSLLPARERGVLERAADRWLAQPVNPEQARPGADLEGLPLGATNRDYVARLNGLDLATPGGRLVAREEAIAHLAEQHLARSLEERPGVTRALDRIVDTVERLGNAFRGHGFNSAESVFRSMTGGRGDRVGLGDPAQRALDVPEGARASVREGPIRVWHGTPHVFGPEATVRLEDGSSVRVRPGEAMDPALAQAIQDGRATVQEHPLGRFDFGRINTGEGAQAFGHGLYFTETRGVAEGYRDRLTPSWANGGLHQWFTDEVAHWRGRGMSAEEVLAALREESLAMRPRAGRVSGAIADAVDTVLADPRTIDALRVLAAERPGTNGSETADAVRAWGMLDQAIQRGAPRGALYEADLHVEEGRLLDWDRPFMDQPAPVQEALRDLGVGAGRVIVPGEARPDGTVPLYGQDSYSGRREAEPAGVLRPMPAEYGGGYQVFRGARPADSSLVGLARTPEAAASMFAAEMGGRLADNAMTGRRAYLGAGEAANRAAGRPLLGRRGSEDASAALRDRGVQGVRYLDGNSRNTGQGTRNYVTFSDDVVEILGRYSRRERRAPIEGLAEVDAGSWRPEGADLKARRAAAVEFLRTLAAEVNARGGIPAAGLDGARVLIGARGLRKVQSHLGDDALAALPALPDLIARGALWRSEEGRDRGTSAMHTLVANVRVGDVVEPMRAMVREAGDGRFWYDFGHLSEDGAASGAAVSGRKPGRAQPEAASAADGEVGAQGRTVPGGAGDGKFSRREEARLPAWHGSAAIFEAEPGRPLGRFRDDKIGTGEGNQSYGYGHYLAENRAVATDYRRRDVRRRGIERLDVPAEQIQVDAVRWPNWEPGAREAAVREIQQAVAGRLRAGERISKDDIARRDVGRDAAFLLRSEGVGLSLDYPVRRRGALYRVDAGVDRGDLLKLDQPVAEQSAALRDRLRRLTDESGATWQAGLDPASLGLTGQVWNLQTPGGMVLGYSRPMFGGFAVYRDGRSVGGEIFSNLADAQRALEADRERTRVDGYAVYNRAGRNPVERSATLDAMGVPGLRFTDAPSRAMPGIGTENFVMFRGEPLRVLGRYSVREGQPVRGLHSALMRFVSDTTKVRQERAPASQWLSQIRNAQGLKAEEVSWTGLGEWLEARGAQPTTRKEIQDFLRQSDLGLYEVRRGGQPEEMTEADLAAEAAFFLEGFFGVRQERGDPDFEAAQEQPFVAQRVREPRTALERQLVSRIEEQLNGERYRDEADFRDHLIDLSFEAVAEGGGTPMAALLVGRQVVLGAAGTGGEGSILVGDGPTRHSGYQAPGERAHYGEVVLTLPSAAESRGRRHADFTHGHWPEDNVVAHARYNQRQDEAGRPVLFVEEVQSDWHQAGREHGYREPPDRARAEALAREGEAAWQRTLAARGALEEAQRAYRRAQARRWSENPEARAAAEAVAALRHAALDADEARQRVRFALGASVDPDSLVLSEVGEGDSRRLYVAVRDTELGNMADRHLAAEISPAWSIENGQPARTGQFIVQRHDPLSPAQWRGGAEPLEAVVVPDMDAALDVARQFGQAGLTALQGVPRRVGMSQGSEATEAAIARLRAEGDEAERLANRLDSEARDAASVLYRIRSEMERVPNPERDALQAAIEAANAEVDAAGAEVTRVNEALRAARGESGARTPDAPFKSSWPTLVMKRLIRMAAETGQQIVSWTDGQMQAWRWGGGSGGGKVERLVWDPETGRLRGADRNGTGKGREWENIRTPTQLREVVGPEVAARLLAAQPSAEAASRPEALTWLPGDLLERAEAGDVEAAREVMTTAARRAEMYRTGWPVDLQALDPVLLDYTRDGPAALRQRRERALADIAAQQQRHLRWEPPEGRPLDPRESAWHEERAAELGDAALALEQIMGGREPDVVREHRELTDIPAAWGLVWQQPDLRQAGDGHEGTREARRIMAARWRETADNREAAGYGADAGHYRASADLLDALNENPDFVPEAAHAAHTHIAWVDSQARPWEAARNWARARMVGETGTSRAVVLDGDAGDFYTGDRAQGMTGFYDKRLPAEVERLIRPFGGKLASTRINIANPGQPARWRTVHAFEITPALRDAVMGDGLPMFSRREGGGEGRREATPLSRFGLSLSVPSDGRHIEELPDGTRAGSYRFEITRGFDRALTVYAEVGPGAYGAPEHSLEISDIQSYPAAGEAFRTTARPGAYQTGRRMGAPPVRAVLQAVLEEVRRDFPDVRSVHGNRATGARKQAGTKPRAAGPDAVVALPSGYAEGGEVGAIAPGMPSAPIAGLGDIPMAPPMPSVGGGTADPETRGARQGIEMWQAAAAVIGAVA